MDKNPEQTAWFFLIAAAILFLVIIVGVPLGVRHYIINAQHEEMAVVESINGTIVVEPPLGRGAVPVLKGQSIVVPIGTLVRADESSEAMVTFFDHSFMRVFSGSTVRLERMIAKRYKAGRVPNIIDLRLIDGHLQIGTAFSDVPLEFTVVTFQSVTNLAPDGSYSIETDNAATEVGTFKGVAQVTAQGRTIELKDRQRTTIAINQSPQPPTSMARDLLVNGNLQQPLGDAWEIFNDQGSDGGTVDGTVKPVVDEGRRALEILRANGHGDHCETGLEQVLNRPLSEPMTSLSVRATIKVRSQGLSGGGYLSSEYPLIIRLTYRDQYDNEAEWIQGFYVQNRDQNPTMYGLEVPAGSWYLYDSGNLLESLPVRPSKLIRIRVYASGWDYNSLISDIALVVE
ncbi:MAG: hypothetical protein GXY52_07405 [Chloroflexi bacterium]|nr:hypothetical protein [Chloroflexota bacterium]